MSPDATPRATTLRFQKLANRIVRGLLRMPGLALLIGRRLIEIEVVGRTSGRRFAVPVAYTADAGGLVVGTPFAWGRNLRTGEPVTIVYKGRRRSFDVTVITDEAGVIAAYATMARDNKQFASFNRIGRDAAGEPDSADLILAHRAGARAFRFTPRA